MQSSQLRRTSLLLCAVLFLVSHVLAVSSTSFCKCICGLNSTIIPLDGTPLDSSTSTLSSLFPSDGTKLETFVPPQLKEGDSSSGEIFDPADQGYDFPSPDDNYARRRRRQVNSDVPDDGLSFDTAAELKEGFDHVYASSEDLDPPLPTASPGAAKEEDEGSLGNSTETQLVTPKRSGTCNDCNRQFCLDHPDFGKMCGEAKDEEVTTTCFKRDSAKDQLVVYTFIVVTVGLLGYAAVRPWLEKKYAAVRERRSYAPVSGTGGGS